MRERERERNRERETDRQRERETDGERERETQPDKGFDQWTILESNIPNLYN